MPWQNKSFETHALDRYLIDDLQNRIGTSDLFEWVEAKADHLSAQGLTNTGYVEFTKSVLQASGIRGIYEDRIVANACIRPTNGEQYLIYYRQGLPSEAARFAIAHEIGHTLWFASGGGGQPLSPVQSKLGKDLTIETLCNRFAAAFLLPRTRVRAFLRALRSNGQYVEAPLHMIPVLSSRFRVAERAVARRFFYEVSEQPVAIVCLRKLNPAGSSNLPTQWVTSWSALPSDGYLKERVAGYRIPLSGVGRYIPASMLPDVQSGGTYAVNLDGRWADGLKTVPTDRARIPFEGMKPSTTNPGFASMVRERLYLMIPLVSHHDQIALAM